MQAKLHKGGKKSIKTLTAKRISSVTSKLWTKQKKRTLKLIIMKTGRSIISTVELEMINLQ
jgi:hypothetical protein